MFLAHKFDICTKYRIIIALTVWVVEIARGLKKAPSIVHAKECIMLYEKRMETLS